MVEQNESEMNESLYVIRLLNTSLKGSEYNISSSNLRVVVLKPEDMVLEDDTLNDDNLLIVPDDEISSSFTLLWNPTGQSELRDIDGNFILHVKPQDVIEYQGVYFSIKPTSDLFWSETVLKFDIAKHLKPEAGEGRGKRRNMLPLVLILPMVITLMIFSYYHFSNEDKSRVDEIASLIHEYNDGLKIITGRDKKVYVFVDSTKDYTWVKQAIGKRKPSFDVIIINESSERRRIASYLTANFPEIKYHFVDLDNPSSPVVILSRERNSESDEILLKKVNSLLMQHTTYPNEFRTKRLSDSIVADYAEQGLRKITQGYSKVQNKDSVHFMNKGTLQDNELNELKYFISNFNAQWLGGYISFSVELEKDWLKGKSFQYGSEGYVKMNNSHWYFPAPI